MEKHLIVTARFVQATDVTKDSPQTKKNLVLNVSWKIGSKQGRDTLVEDSHAFSISRNTFCFFTQTMIFLYSQSIISFIAFCSEMLALPLPCLCGMYLYWFGRGCRTHLITLMWRLNVMHVNAFKSSYLAYEKNKYLNVL